MIDGTGMLRSQFAGYGEKVVATKSRQDQEPTRPLEIRRNRAVPFIVHADLQDCQRESLKSFMPEEKSFSPSS